MEKPAVWVGVDVSKEQLEVALRPSGEQFSLPNDARALRILVKRFNRGRPHTRVHRAVGKVIDQFAL